MSSPYLDTSFQDKLLDATTITHLFSTTVDVCMRAWSEASEFRYQFDYEITPDALSGQLANINQVYTQRAAMRLLGISVILIGLDQEFGSQCFKLPCWLLHRISRNISGLKTARSHLEKKWKKLDNGKGGEDAAKAGKRKSLIQDVAQKTNEVAGDGTTTATVLACAIYLEGVKNVAAGCNPMDLRRGSQAAVDSVIQFLSAQTKAITTTSEIAQVATISVNGDTHVGNLIAQAMEKVGKDGVRRVWLMGLRKKGRWWWGPWRYGRGADLIEPEEIGKGIMSDTEEEDETVRGKMQYSWNCYAEKD